MDIFNAQGLFKLWVMVGATVNDDRNEVVATVAFLSKHGSATQTKQTNKQQQQ